MSDSRQEQQSLTREQITGARSIISPTIAADMLRQQHGINVLYEGHFYGTDMTDSQVRKDLEKKETDGKDLTPREKDFLARSKVWIGKGEAEKLPSVEVDKQDNLVTSFGCVEVSHQINGVVKLWLGQSPDGKRRSLASLLTEDPHDKRSFTYQTLESYVKILDLFDFNVIDKKSELGKSLDTILEFLKSDVIPMMSLPEVEQIMIMGEIDGELRAAKGNRSSYIDRAKRVFEKRSKRLSVRGVSGKEKETRGEHLYHMFAKVDALQFLPIRLQEHMFTLASRVNHVRLLEHFEQRGVDLIQLKQEIGEILKEDVPLNDKSGELSSGYEAWLRKLLPKIKIISNIIHDDFPHDTAYLLGQVLEKKQATCAGKTNMLTLLLQSVALDAVNTKASIFAFSNRKSDHRLTSVKLPHGVFLTLDTNWSDSSGYFGFDFHHNVAINIPTGLTENDGEMAIVDAKQNHKVYLVTNRGFEQYRPIGGQHPLLAMDVYQVDYDALNFSWNIFENMQIQHVSNEESIKTAMIFTEKHLAYQPFDTDGFALYLAYIRVANKNKDFTDTKLRDASFLEELCKRGEFLLQYNPRNVRLRLELAEIADLYDYSDKKLDRERVNNMVGQLQYIIDHESYIEGDASVSIHYCHTFQANIYALYVDQFIQKFGSKEQVLQEAYTLIESSIKHNPQDEFALFSMARLLKIYPTEFPSQFSIKEHALISSYKFFLDAIKIQNSSRNQYELWELYSSNIDTFEKYFRSQGGNTIYDEMLKCLASAQEDKQDARYQYALLIANHYQDITLLDISKIRLFRGGLKMLDEYVEKSPYLLTPNEKRKISLLRFRINRLLHSYFEDVVG
jgi:hypothetical protein